MTTPREQLIEAIARALTTPRVREDELQGHVGDLHFYRAVTAIQALSDLGAVVLMPMKAKDLKEGQEFVESQLNDFVGMGKRDDDGGFFCWNADKHYAGDHTVYVNALENEQS
jgi:hypothetical protein